MGRIWALWCLGLGCASASPRSELAPHAPKAVLQFLWARPLTSYEYYLSGMQEPARTSSDEPMAQAPSPPVAAATPAGVDDSLQPPNTSLNDWKPEELAVSVVDPSSKRIYVGSASGEFFCLRDRDGRVLWRIRTDGAVASRPLLIPRTKTIYFGSDDGHLYAADAESGRVHWRYATRGTVRQAPTYESGVLYFTSGESRVYAVEARTGRWRWHYEREQPEGFTIHGDSGATFARGRIYAGFADGTVVALDARTGELLWSRSLAGDTSRFFDADGTPVYDSRSDTLFVSAQATGVYALDPDDGTVRWRIPLRGASAPRPYGDFIYVGAAEGGLVAASLQGEVVWQQTLDAGVPAAPVVSGPFLFLSLSSHGLYVVNRQSGRLLTVFAPGEGISAEAAIHEGRLYVLSNRGWLYAAAVPLTEL